MDLDHGKLFIGGISWETTEEKLKDYFNVYGEVVQAVIMKDRTTGRARGFGFVVFSDPAVADGVLQEKHTIDGRVVEAKKAVPRDEQQHFLRSNNGSPGPGIQTRTKKIFVGGLASTVTEANLKKYFEEFGRITDAVVMYDHGTQRPRGFGFITFDSEVAVDNVLQKTFHEINGKMVEVKRAIPKELSAGPTRSNGAVFGAGSGRGPGYGGGYPQGFNSSPAVGYGARLDGRYTPSPGGRGGYPPYGLAGYGGAGGYGSPTNGPYSGSAYGSNAGYVASGTYGGGGYPGTGTYGGGVGGYGSNGAASGGYSSTSGRNLWSSGGAGYGSGSNSTGYGGNGSAGMSNYGSLGTWSSSQTPGSGAAYGSSYYGSSDGGYGSTFAGYVRGSVNYGSSLGGYGTGGEGNGSYTGGHGDVYGRSGFTDTTWRSSGIDSTAGGSAGASFAMGGSGTTDGAASGSAGYGRYTVVGRQSHRGVAA